MSHLIRSLEARELKKRSWAIRLADDLTSLFGSFLFLIINCLFFVFWILLNTGQINGIPPFDPFPFPLMTTIVSLEAIILTLIVLMSQNRSSFITSLREEIDMQVNLASEREITKILQVLRKLADKQGIRLDDKELDEMLKEIEVSYIERKLEQQMTQNSKMLIQDVVEKVEEKIASKK
jgi:uncharacterized membrane protein